MRLPWLLCRIACFIVVTMPVFSQQAVDPSARYHRLICLVHLTGSGKADDPIRPEFVASALNPANGIVAWSTLPTDKKNMVILHVVATNRKALDGILSDKRSGIKVFEVGKNGKSEIETEMKKEKKDFDLSQFEVIAQ